MSLIVQLSPFFRQVSLENPHFGGQGPQKIKILFCLFERRMLCQIFGMKKIQNISRPLWGPVPPKLGGPIFLKTCKNSNFFGWHIKALYLTIPKMYNMPYVRPCTPPIYELEKSAFFLNTQLPTAVAPPLFGLGA